MKKFLLQYVSDIHLEYSHKIPNIKPIVNNIALLGDIGSPRMSLYKDFLKDVSNKFDNVFLVSGNHEYWNMPMYGDRIYSKEDIDEMIEDQISKYPNIHYLNNKSYIDNNVVIIGSTLWSEIPEEKKEVASRIVGDCKMIKYNNSIDQRLNNQMFYDCSEFIGKKIKDNIDKKVVVLTHHCPSYKFISEKFKNYNNNFAFASNLDHMLSSPVCVWLSGHTHGNFYKVINGVICSINCQGYRKENLKDYNVEKYIQLYC
ncbi:metallophosphatase [Catovirus CTV1]|uniref:Metallophosphatase n=1 Tax=Catovirus CTV1 TaxID=1977631 RepID=A0A1V0SAD5_9VIRU|nr:metallophosphatase [Catovirus CTV1]